MKTLSTTLAIFALLLSTTAFSSVGSGEITPTLRPRDAGFEVNISIDTNNITPILRPRDPGFEVNISIDTNNITPILRPRDPGFVSKF